ncbi:hypothetical protein BC567DRAFT_86487 [Phyllosticta citribraziliensis]
MNIRGGAVCLHDGGRLSRPQKKSGLDVPRWLARGHDRISCRRAAITGISANNLESNRGLADMDSNRGATVEGCRFQRLGRRSFSRVSIRRPRTAAFSVLPTQRMLCLDLKPEAGFFVSGRLLPEMSSTGRKPPSSFQRTANPSTPVLISRVSESGLRLPN